MDIGMDPYYHGGDTFSFWGRRAKAKVNAKAKLAKEEAINGKSLASIQSRPIWQRLSPKANKKSPVLESCSQALVVLIDMEDAVE